MTHTGAAVVLLCLLEEVPGIRGDKIFPHFGIASLINIKTDRLSANFGINKNLIVYHRIKAFSVSCDGRRHSTLVLIQISRAADTASACQNALDQVWIAVREIHMFYNEDHEGQELEIMLHNPLFPQSLRYVDKFWRFGHCLEDQSTTRLWAAQNFLYPQLLCCLFLQMRMSGEWAGLSPVS